jgi:hypothetical protein
MLDNIAANSLFNEVVRAADDLPAELRAGELTDCRESCFDETYVEFLDEQIELSPRGPEWTERLTTRRKGLAPFCRVRLICGHVRAGTTGYTVYIEPQSRCVVYWEEYQDHYRVATGVDQVSC